MIFAFDNSFWTCRSVFKLQVCVGVLVDVSDSMQNALQVSTGVDDIKDEQISRFQSIFNTIISIVEQSVDTNSEDTSELFVLAFGLNDTGVDLCDLLTFLDISAYAERNRVTAEMARHEFMTLFSENGVSCLNKEIWDCFSDDKIEFFYSVLCHSATKRQKLVPQIIQTLMPNLCLQRHTAAKKIDEKQETEWKRELIDLLEKNGAPEAKKYVDKYVDEEKAKLLYNVFSVDIPALKEIVDALPPECKQTTIRSNPNYIAVAAGAGSLIFWAGPLLVTPVFGLFAMPAVVVATASATTTECNEAEKEGTDEYTDDAIKKAQKLVQQKLLKIIPVEILRSLYETKLYKFKAVVKLLNEISKGSTTSESQKLTRKQLNKLSKSIEPFIFGQTPMCKALRYAYKSFKYANISPKVLFLLSDGEATDGDPVNEATKLKNEGVTVFSCLLTSDHIEKPRQLFYEADERWADSQCDMLKMSSVVDNCYPAMRFLLDKKWTLPTSGKSHLFIQANHPDVIDEFSSMINQVFHSNNVMLNILGSVSLDMYINDSNTKHKPQEQRDNTCYAHAIAAVFHLAMRRIYGREGGIPEFESVLDNLIREFGVDCAPVKTVLDKSCPRYRLRYKRVDEVGARQAVNERRPVVATFQLDGQKWGAFNSFFSDKSNAKTVLTKEDLLKFSGGDLGGHAVVLVKIDPGYLLFMNSSGTEWADGGFFRVRDKSVLDKMFFYDVYWELEDLTECEKKAYEDYCKTVGNDIIKKLPENVKRSPYKCPKCQVSSPANTFEGHLLEATCPSCGQNFEPTAIGFFQTYA